MGVSDERFDVHPDVRHLEEVRVRVGHVSAGDGASGGVDGVGPGAGGGAGRLVDAGGAGRERCGHEHPGLGGVELAVTVGVTGLVHGGAVVGVGDGHVGQRDVAGVRHGVGDDHVVAFADQWGAGGGVSVERGLHCRFDVDDRVHAEVVGGVLVGEGFAGNGGVAVHSDGDRTGAGHRTDVGVRPGDCRSERHTGDGLADCEGGDRVLGAETTVDDLVVEELVVDDHHVGEGHVAGVPNRVRPADRVASGDVRAGRSGVRVEGGLDELVDRQARVHTEVVRRVGVRHGAARDDLVELADGVRSDSGDRTDVGVVVAGSDSVEGAGHLLPDSQRIRRAGDDTFDVVGQLHLGQRDVAGVGDHVGEPDRATFGDRWGGCLGVRIPDGLHELLHVDRGGGRCVVGGVGVGDVLAGHHFTVRADRGRTGAGGGADVHVLAGVDRRDAGDDTGHRFGGCQLGFRAADRTDDVVGHLHIGQDRVAGVRHHIGEADGAGGVDERAATGGVGVVVGLDELLDVDRRVRTVVVGDVGVGRVRQTRDRRSVRVGRGAGRCAGVQVGAGDCDTDGVAGHRRARVEAGGGAGDRTDDVVGDRDVGQDGVAGVRDHIAEPGRGAGCDGRAGSCRVGVVQGLDELLDVDRRCGAEVVRRVGVRDVRLAGDRHTGRIGRIAGRGADVAVLAGDGHTGVFERPDLGEIEETVVVEVT